MTEPKRLLEAGDTPQVLRAALRALEAQGPDAATQARIGARVAAPERLQPRRTRARYAWLALAAFGAALIAGRALRVEEAAQPARATRQAPAAHAPIAPEAPARAPGEAAVMPRVRRAERSTPEVEPIAPEIALRRASAPAPAPAARPKRAAPARVTPAARAPALTLEPLAPSGAPAPSDAAATAAASPAPDSVEVDEQRALEEPQDEASLLYRARRLASSDPKAALRLIVLHEASFPNGSFGEERDMLEIQIHERLGHRALAQRLTAQFRARYPSSVYRTGAR